MTQHIHLPSIFLASSIAIAVIIFCISELKKINKEIESKPKKQSISIPAKNKKELTELEGFTLGGVILLMLSIVILTSVSFLTISAFLFFSVLIIGAAYSK